MAFSARMVEQTTTAPALVHRLVRIFGFLSLVATMPLVEYSMNGGAIRVYIGLGVPWAYMRALTYPRWSLTDVTILGGTAPAVAAVLLSTLVLAVVAERFLLLHGPLRALVWASVLAWVAVFGPTPFWLFTLVAVPEVTAVLCVIGIAVEHRRRSAKAWQQLA